MNLENLSTLDPKTALNQFCQRFCQRPVTKADITYTTNKFGTNFQAIVKLNCMVGEQYAGETQLNPKDAEKSAAYQALLAHTETMASLPPSLSKDPARRQQQQQERRAKLASGEAGEDVKDGTQSGNPALTPKVQLNTTCMKIAHRYLRKGETVYESRQVLGGYQATVKLTCLPGNWSSRVWAGEVCSNKQKAEQSAATIALQQIANDEELSSISKSEAGIAGGKGGKGLGGKGKGWGYWDMWMGKGGNFMGGSGPDLPRERVNEEVHTGEVFDWKEKYGWIRPTSPVEHDAAKHRDGRVYVSSKDCGNIELAKGAMVKFKVYVDSSGLGAEEVEQV